ncbi:MAG: sugar transferase [Deltaproteobacteria bacterium]|nr:sugar transferase [Deltaproteobacteria bacterium]
MGKRLFDLIFCLIALAVLFPIFAVLCLLIRRDGGPGFFWQERVGKNGRLFNLYKFRSMVVNADRLGPQVTAQHDPRITRIGSILRKTKLDELPQFLNVFKGDMSLVGPRPEVLHYVNKWSIEDRKIVLSVRPGMTDYATLCYSNEQAVLAKAADVEEAYLESIMPHKLKMYHRYVRKQSFFLDIRIILATLSKILGVARMVRVLEERRCDDPIFNKELS